MFETETFLLLTAIVFTFVGMYMQKTNQKDDTKKLVENIIDDLVRQGFIKHHKDSKGETELMKWWEEFPKEVDNKAD